MLAMVLCILAVAASAQAQHTPARCRKAPLPLARDLNDLSVSIGLRVAFAPNGIRDAWFPWPEQSGSP